MDLSGIWNLTNSFLGGALLTLLSLALTSIISRIVKRQILHYNSLVILETELNEMIGIIKDNIYLLPNFKTSIKNGNIYWSQIKIIIVDKNHLSNLADIELINDVFEFFYKIRKLNDDIENLNKGYSDIKNAYIEKNISVKHYIQNAVEVSKQIDILEVFQDDLMKNLLELMAKIRIHIKKDKPFLVKIQEKFNPNSSQKITVIEFEEEKKKLFQELEENSRKSREELVTVFEKIK